MCAAESWTAGRRPFNAFVPMIGTARRTWGRGKHVHHAASADVGRSQSVGVRGVGRSGIWSGLMWSGSGAGIGLELSEMFPNGLEWLRCDLRIRCSSCSAHCVGRPWGSRGRRFKSCRPDGTGEAR
jgi:hypothetical protein